MQGKADKRKRDDDESNVGRHALNDLFWWNSKFISQSIPPLMYVCSIFQVPGTLRKIPRLPQAQPHTEQLSIPKISYDDLTTEYSALKLRKDDSMKTQNKISRDCQSAVYHLHRGELDLAKQV